MKKSKKANPVFSFGTRTLFAVAATVAVAAAGPAAAATPTVAPVDVAGPTVVDQAAAEAEFVAAVSASMNAKAQAADATWHTPVASYYISSYFDEMRPEGQHSATDLAGPQGQDVLAGRSGVVTAAGWQDGYGFTVEIDHGDGNATLYAHLMSEPYVGVGQRVSGGYPIGALGTTGYSTGPHLHLELTQNGVLVDPISVLPIPPSAG